MNDTRFDTISRSLASATSRRSVMKLLAGGLAGGVVASAGLGEAMAKKQRAKPAGSLTQPVTGTVANGGSFSGTYTITKFAKQAGNLVAIGTLSGTLTDAGGTVIGTVTDQAVTIPIDLGGSSGSCEILHLDLGPLDLNLLGLQVHLDEVVLDITAQAGSGNLLGNLLCSIAHLLDKGGPVSGLVGLLNNLLRALG